MYVVFYIYFYLSLLLAFFLYFGFICFVTVPLNTVTWSHGAIEMLLLLLLLLLLSIVVPSL